MSEFSFPGGYKNLPENVQEVLRLSAMLAGLGSLMSEDNIPEVEAEYMGHTAEKQEARALSIALTHGLLAEAGIIILDDLFDDVCLLQKVSDDHLNLREIVHKDTAVLCWLPSRFAHHYDAVFARQFLVAMADVIAALSSGWSSCPTLSHELALHVLLDRAEALADLHEGMSDHLDAGWRAMMEDLLFEDMDFRLLYDPSMDGIEDYPVPELGRAPLKFESWFQPFNPARFPIPYARHDT